MIRTNKDNAAIRRALTTLKKLEVIVEPNITVIGNNSKVLIRIIIDSELIQPKKRVPKKKLKLAKSYVTINIKKS